MPGQRSTLPKPAARDSLQTCRHPEKLGGDGLGFFGDHVVGETAQAGDFHLDAVAGLHPQGRLASRPHPAGGAGGDHVASL